MLAVWKQEHIRDKRILCVEARETGVPPPIPEELIEGFDSTTNNKEKHEVLSPYCKGFFGYPPCPFFYHCHAGIFESIGGEKSYVYRDYDGQHKPFIKVNKRLDFDD